jgi:hypothetical protein
MMTEPFIPLSHLELDIDAPGNGWAAYLAEKRINVVLDDLGRLSISRGDARTLFTERRQHEQRAREIASANEQKAEEGDRAFREQLWGGVRADRMPSDGRPADVMLAAAAQAAGLRRQSVLQHALQNSGELVYHPLSSTSDEE